MPREDLFICGSVLSNNVQGFDAAYKLSAKGCKENLEAFAVGGIDVRSRALAQTMGLCGDVYSVHVSDTMNE